MLARHLLTPSFCVIIALMEKDEIIEKIAALVDNRERYQRVLGQLALEYRKRFGGIESLKELSREIAERHGLKVAPATLHNYSWVEDRLKDFDVPEDVPFRVRQVIAGSSNPQEWIDKLKEGATTNEIVVGIKGTKPRPLIECPNCHFAFEKPLYAEAVERAKEETKDFIY